MIRLLFVGDGERDAATVPRLVKRLLRAPIQQKTLTWARLHARARSSRLSGRGYGPKLLYAFRQARDRHSNGLVATVDADKEKPRHRLRAMQQARAEDREIHPSLPTALGEAVPHGEAWLLDDPAAVRRTLRLSTEVKIPPVRETKNPKGVLQGLLAKSPHATERPIVIWGEIARELDTERCSHAKTTGFQGFVEEVRHELGPLVVQARGEA